jgi:predicted dehydrogenase
VKGILCEKPFTGSARGAQRIIDACRQRDVKLVVNFTRRWDEAHVVLADRIQKGAIGTPREVLAAYTGTLRGNGAHFLDALCMLVPGSWRVDWAIRSDAPHDDGPIEAVLSSESARAILAPVRDPEYFVFELYIFGTKGRARLSFQGNDVRIDQPQPHDDFPGYRYLQEVEQLPKMTIPAAFGHAVRGLADAVQNNRAPAVPADVHIPALALADAIVERANEKGTQ